MLSVVAASPNFTLNDIAANPFGSVLVLLSAVVVIGVLLFLIIAAFNKKRSGLDHTFFVGQWKKIENFKAQGSAGWQVAIMEADKLLDHAMKVRGVPGETMGDRLKNSKGYFMNIDAVWRAHKLRNQLAHEQNVSLNSMAVDQALRNFKAALKDLGAF